MGNTSGRRRRLSFWRPAERPARSQGAGPTDAHETSIGLVLAGGGARGAWEAGVCAYVFEALAREHVLPAGRRPLEAICGSSVGAINACGLAAHADDLASASAMVARQWSQLSLGEVVRFDRRRVLATLRALIGHPPRRPSPELQRGGLFDSAPLEALLRGLVPFHRIGEQLRARHLRAIAVSATHIGTGRSTLFVQRSPELAVVPEQAPRGHVEVELGLEHALASGAIPFLFPAVRIGGELYCDGSLREHVPLSPAIRLGCRELLIVHPKSPTPSGDAREDLGADFFPGPLFLLGKVLNALVLDRVDEDLERLQQMNEVLEAGVRAYGPAFLDTVNAGRPVALRPIRTVYISPSCDIGQMAADLVRSPRFKRRQAGAVGRMLARLADRGGATNADLLSYLLFDGGFARDLIALGKEDARRQHDAVVAMFAGVGDERTPHAVPV